MKSAAVAVVLALAVSTSCGNGVHGGRGPARSGEPGELSRAGERAAQARGKRKKPSRSAGSGKREAGAGSKPSSAKAKADKTNDVAREVGALQRGTAAWYGGELHGKPTASGEPFDKGQMTAAHRTLPMGTTVRVTNEKNSTSVTVRINDRGPFGKRNRIIDVSEAAAKILGIIEAGTCPITLEVLTLPEPRKDKTS